MPPAKPQPTQPDSTTNENLSSTQKQTMPHVPFSFPIRCHLISLSHVCPSVQVIHSVVVGQEHSTTDTLLQEHGSSSSTQEGNDGEDLVSAGSVHGGICGSWGGCCCRCFRCCCCCRRRGGLGARDGAGEWWALCDGGDGLFIRPSVSRCLGYTLSLPGYPHGVHEA